MKTATLSALLLAAFSVGDVSAQTAPAPDPVAAAMAALAQIDGTIMVSGTREPVEVIRDKFGVPHIYAKNTGDLFLAQGFVVAQDRMWQLEMWRRNGEGRLAEVLGKDYVRRDTFARMLQFRGNWDAEYRKYHPQGKLIFDSFAKGVNAAIQKALDERKVPVEFDRMGFAPQPVWTAKTILTRLPGWAMTRNASSELARALDIKRLGLERTRELKPTEPERAFVIPEGLNLDDIEPGILDIARDANNYRFPVAGSSGDGAEISTDAPGFLVPGDERPSASNNWVVSGRKSATGKPLLANDPHRDLVNPSLRYVVHLSAPGWNAIGATEPGVPGIAIGHNDRVAWGFTILGVDQQDLYVEETDPADPNRYMWKGEWREMALSRELIYVKGQAAPVEVTLKRTHHGPVVHENAAKNRAYAVRWAGAETGGAGYVGALGVMQSRNWDEFRTNMARAWFTPSHSIVYADVDGNIGYLGVALSPVRRNWDGLLPVPGKDGKYEWEGYVPFEKLPASFNPPGGFFNTSNNDVVPKIVAGYDQPLGFEYGASFRYDRILEVLKAKPRFTLTDMQALQQDTVSLPARALVPSILAFTFAKPELERAQRLFIGWDYSLRKDSPAAAVYEALQLKLPPLAYAPFLSDAERFTYRGYDLRRVLGWMSKPPATYGASPKERRDTRDRILREAFEQAVAHLVKLRGEDMKNWAWGDIHTADFVHPLSGRVASSTADVFAITPVPRGGDGYTPMAATSMSENNTKQVAGASFSFVADVADWDRSTFLSAPGNSAQPLSPFYSNLIESWAAGKGNPFVYSRAAVEGAKANSLVLAPILDRTEPGPEEPFEPVQKELFAAAGGQPIAVADFDNDGDLDMYVGFRGAPSRLYRNEGGRFTEVAAAFGLDEGDEVRAAAWGDYDSDGNLDLFVGFARGARLRNKLYRNVVDANHDQGRHFVEVGAAMGVDDFGTTRQPVFIDYDTDGDVDLYVAFRDRPNALYRNDGPGKPFIDVAPAVGLADPRKTVGSLWFDMDQDGDLDVFVANQDGDTNGFFRNDAGHFTDVARELGMDGLGRPPVYGGVGATLLDYDNDGDFDLYLGNYGPNNLYRNDGGGKFSDIAAALGVAGDYHATTVVSGDYDNDGREDLYVASYLTAVMQARDYLYHNDGPAGFSDRLPSYVAKHDATHGVQFFDFDQDGDLDLMGADNLQYGSNALFRNRKGGRSLQALVTDANGRLTQAGSEVRLYKAGARDLLGTRIVDTGGGYCSQNAMAVHFGLGDYAGLVDVEVTTPGTRRVTRVESVDPSAPTSRLMRVNVPRP